MASHQPDSFAAVIRTFLVLLLLAAIGVVFSMALRAPAAPWGERELLVADRIVDGSAPISSAWGDGGGARLVSPAGRIHLRMEDRIFAGNPAGYRFAGAMWLALLALTFSAILLRAGTPPLLACLAALAFALWPAAVMAAFDLAGRGALLATALAAFSLLAAQAASDRARAAHDPYGLIFLCALLAVIASAVSAAGMALAPALLALACLGAERTRGGIGFASLLGAISGFTSFALSAAGGSALDLTAFAANDPGIFARAAVALATLPLAAPEPVPMIGALALGLCTVALFAAAAGAGSTGAPISAWRRVLATVLILGAALLPLCCERAATPGSMAAAALALPLIVVGSLALLGRRGPRARAAIAVVLVLLVAGGFIASWRLAASLVDARPALEDLALRMPTSVETHLRRADWIAFKDSARQAADALDEAIVSFTAADGGDPPPRMLVAAARAQAEAAAEEAARGMTILAAERSTKSVALLDRLPAATSGALRIEERLIRARLALLAEPMRLRDALALLTDLEGARALDDQLRIERWLLLGHVRSEYAYETEALSAYMQALQLDPRSFEVTYHLGNFLVTLADAQERAGEIEKATRLRQEAIVHLQAAWTSRALDAHGEYGRLLCVQLGGVFGKLGMSIESRAILEIGRERWPDDPRILFNFSLSLLGVPSTTARGETEMMGAVSRARELRLAEADYFAAVLADHLVRRGNQLLERAQISEAERLAAMAGEAAPTYLAAQILSADVRFAQARFDDAINGYQKAMELAPDSHAAFVKFQHARLKRGLAGLVEMSRLKVSLRQPGADAAAICVTYEAIKSRAISDFNSFIEALPGDEEIDNAKARLESIEHAQCLEEEDADVVPNAQLTDVVREQLKRAREHYERGAMAHAEGRYEDAVAEFQKAINKVSADPRLHYAKALSLLEIPGQRSSAYLSFDRALSLDTRLEAPELLFHISELALEFAAVGIVPEDVEIRIRRQMDEEDNDPVVWLRAQADNWLTMFLQLAGATHPYSDRARVLLSELRR